jgi:hypothetical protein
MEFVANNVAPVSASHIVKVEGITRREPETHSLIWLLEDDRQY